MDRTKDMRNRRYWPIVASVAVLVLSPLLEIVTGTEILYLLVLPALTVTIGVLVRFSRRELGISLGGGRTYLVALLYPVAVIGVLALIAWAAGAVRPEEKPVSKVGILFAAMFVQTVVGAFITEEGFFRGALWGTVERSYRSTWVILIWTSLVFSLWHLPVALIEQDFRLPVTVIPVYLANVFLIGLCWGILRVASGSILVASVAHGMWNALVYVFFGYGTETGTLGVKAYELFCPERGLLGMVMNVISCVLLWLWWRGTASPSTGANG